MFSIKKESCTTENNNCCSAKVKGDSCCPSCQESAKGVLAKTLEHLLIDETTKNLNCFDGFYYCKTPSCSVVYFKDENFFTQQDMNVVVGLKDGAIPATVCYCFEWTKEKIAEELQKNGKTIALEDIKAKMENPGCACEVLNPSGGCCLGDVGKAIKELQKN